MNYVRRIIMVFVASIVLSVSAVIQAQTKSPFSGMNDAEIKQLEAEMASFQKEIDSLSPSEQEAFFKSMEEAVQKIDNLSKTPDGKALLDKLDRGELSDEELDKLINQIVEEPIQQEPLAPSAVTKPEPVEKTAPKPVVTTKQQAAADMVNDLINHSNSFMVKMAITHELPGKIKNWRKKGFIAWGPNLTLNKFKLDIEKFVQQLTDLVEKDKKTKTFIHIDNLLANESLYNNLKKVHRVLIDQEPKIEELLPLSGKMSESSKNAFQKTINQYIEAIYTLAIPEEIKKLISKFDPTAKTLREQEDAARKKADDLRKTKSGSPTIVKTKEYSDDYRSFPSEQEYERTPAESRYASTIPSYAPSYQPDFLPSAGKMEPQAETGGKQSSASDKEKAEQEEGKEEKGDKKEREDKEQGSAASEKEKTFPDADKLLEKITVNIENVANAIKKSTVLSDIQAHLTGDGQVDIEFATEVLPELIRDLSLRKGAIGTLQQMEGKLPISALDNYKKKLKDLYEEHSEQLDPLLTQLATLETNWDTLINKISAAKKYAYFGIQEEKTVQPEQSEQDIDALLEKAEKSSKSIDEGLKKALKATEKTTVPSTPIDSQLEEIKRKVPTPYSIKELQKNLADLKSAVDTFGASRKKAKPQTRRRP